MSEILLQIVSVASLINHSLMYGVLSNLNPEEKKIWNQQSEEIQKLVHEKSFVGNTSEEHFKAFPKYHQISLN